MRYIFLFRFFYFKSTDSFFFSISAALLENELVDQICQHFLRILKQSKQENEAELLMLLDILHLFLTNCENNVSVNWLLFVLIEDMSRAKLHSC